MSTEEAIPLVILVIAAGMLIMWKNSKSSDALTGRTIPGFDGKWDCPPMSKGMCTERPNSNQATLKIKLGHSGLKQATTKA
jgi:hypothetical protein